VPRDDVGALLTRALVDYRAGNYPGHCLTKAQDAALPLPLLRGLPRVL